MPTDQAAAGTHLVAATGPGWPQCSLGRQIGLFALVAAAVALGGCRADSERPWNVVVVLVDTLRADRMSLYGYERETTPVLDRLDATVFENVTSQAACTFPSVNSILTSRHPFQFLGRARTDLPTRRDMSMRPEIPTLGEMLQARGYATAAVSASPIVRNRPTETNRGGGFAQGFDEFHEDCFEQDAACINRAAFKILDRTDKPSFLYLHYMEPHNPYQPPATHPRRFATFESDRWFIRDGELRPIARWMKGLLELEMRGQDWANLWSLYDEEILYFDSQFEVLIEGLRKRRLLDRTILVLLSDHGEELYDHGHISHCGDLAYQSVIGTPLVVRIPGIEGGRRIARVQNLDAVPTILDYLGFVDQLPGLDGKSLRPVIEGQPTHHRYVFSMQGWTRVVISRNIKLIHDLRTGTSQLFDLDADPGEQRNLAEERPVDRADLETVMQKWLERVERASQDSTAHSDEVRRQLEAVGYL